MAKCLYFRQSMTSPEQVFQVQAAAAAASASAAAAANANAAAAAASPGSDGGGGAGEADASANLQTEGPPAAPEHLPPHPDRNAARTLSSPHSLSSLDSGSPLAPLPAAASGSSPSDPSAALPTSLQALFSLNPPSYATAGGGAQAQEGGQPSPSLSDAILETDIFLVRASYPLMTVLSCVSCLFEKAS